MNAVAAVQIRDSVPTAITSRLLAEIGGERDAAGLPQPMQVTARHVFAPRGACIHPADGSLWVSDTGHHRLLGWPQLPATGEPAAWLFGQPGFEHEGRNAGAPVSAMSVDVPTGIVPYGDGLAVADAWNHRVLIWHERPAGINCPADRVLGQCDFSGDQPNRGSDEPSAASMHWPFGLFVHGDTLYVADTGNRRVLIWRGLPEQNGQPADQVLGQADFSRRDENAGDEVCAASMRWPHALTVWRDRLCVADAGNNRIMVFKNALPETGAACEFLLGQGDGRSVAHTRGRIGTAGDALNMPYGLAASGDWLLAADTASSRLLGWHVSDLATGAPATALAGQADLDSQGDNRWGPVLPDSLCWPYGVSVAGSKLVTADTGNSRVLVHELLL